MSTTGKQLSSSSGSLVSTSSSTTVSPYTLSSSDNPSTVNSYVLLNGENYNEWSAEMLNALQAKRKTGSVDGSITKPSSDDPNFENWKTVNSMIVGWIRASIEVKVKSTVTFISDANLLWDETDELKTYQASAVCPHGSTMSTLIKERDNEKFHQFVMGLDNSRFGGICTSMINMDPLPSLGVAYSKVIREEQRLASSRHQEQWQEAVGFVVHRELVSPSMIAENQPVNRVESSIVRSRPVLCSHCGRTGNEKKDCWSLVSFPDWWMDRNGAGRGSGGRGSSGRGAEITSTNSSDKLSGKPKFGDVILDMTGNLTLLTNIGPISPCSDRFSRTLIGRGEECDGVYYLTDVATVKIHIVNVSSDQALWHQRLGDPSYSVLSVLPMVSVSGSSNSYLSCDVCFRAKQTREVFPDSINKVSDCFSLIHCDVCGPYRVPSSCGAVYFLTIVDDFSRSVWTYLLLEKSEVHTVLTNFPAYTDKKFGKPVKTVRSDNET
ncbi:PREDICTED: uncharacterized protein LOC104709252 [Camelina sativa]|uniref:Uncharacterized protein LOC104709252 n=1 Tax=Camelina sativa TaxID=90675 RepID=A0ABM0TCI6_CAMSA|nr:PREDICTED: uncharacterized protein LOC104709252 [Camelina sativa]